MGFFKNLKQAYKEESEKLDAEIEAAGGAHAYWKQKEREANEKIEQIKAERATQAGQRRENGVPLAIYNIMTGADDVGLS